MLASSRFTALLLLISLFAILERCEPVAGQQAKEKTAPKAKANGSLLVPEPLAIRLGESLSTMTLVVRPPAVKGAVSWSIETRRHRSQASSLNISPDGAMAATGSWDGTIHLWEIATGKLLRVLVGHNSAVHGVAFSPDGSVIASAGSYDETVRIWNAKTGMTLRILKKHKGFTSGVAWSPDGSTLAVSGGASGFVTFWDPIQSKQLRTIEHGNPVSGMAWSPDGKVVACATTQGAFLWKAEDGSNLGTIKVAGNRVPAVGWSPDSIHLLVGAMKTVDVWNVPGNKLVSSLSGTGFIVSWSPDGNTLATGWGDGMILWDAKTFARQRVAAVAARAFGWDKKTGVLFAVTPQDLVSLDVADDKKTRSFGVAEADTLLWNAGRPIVSGIQDKTIKLWEPAKGSLLATLNGHNDAVLCAAWSKDGKQLASGSKDLTARIWDGKNGALLRTLGGHTKEIKAVAWSSDGKLATGSADNLVRIFLPDQDRALELKGHTHPVNTVVWRDSKTVLSGSDDGKILFWNIESPKPIQSIDVNHDVFSIALSPDGNYLACGSNDDVARVYSFSGGNALHTLDPKTGSAEFYDLTWSPDSSALATTNYRMFLWSPKTEKQLHGYEMGGPAHGIAFTADGRTTVAGCLDRAIRFCDTPKGFLRGTIIRDTKQLVSVSAEGPFKAPGEIDAEFVFVVQAEKSQDLYDSKTFQSKFGWKNNPAAVKLTEGK